MWRIAVALCNGGVEWWYCPRTNREVLRSRAGHIYDFRQNKFGTFICRRQDELFQFT